MQRLRRAAVALGLGAVWGVSTGVYNHLDDGRPWPRAISHGVVIGILIMAPIFYLIDTIKASRNRP